MTLGPKMSIPEDLFAALGRVVGPRPLELSSVEIARDFGNAAGKAGLAVLTSFLENPADGILSASL
jgi:hypothetical protein